MNGQAKDLSDRNTFFIYRSEERGSGIKAKCSLISAYVRLCSLDGRKIVEAPTVVSICNTVPKFLCCSGAPGTTRNANLYGGESL